MSDGLALELQADPAAVARNQTESPPGDSHVDLLPPVEREAVVLDPVTEDDASARHLGNDDQPVLGAAHPVAPVPVETTMPDED